MKKTLEILRYPDNRLRRRCLPVRRFDDALRQLADDMLFTMYASNGIGLAAAQVGVLKRLIVVDLTQEPGSARVFVNPEILSARGRVVSQEGCLSVPDVYAQVKRRSSVEVRYHTPNGKERRLNCDGLLAICIQHEIDHLDGRLFVDYLSPFQRLRARMVAQRHRKRTLANVI